MPAVIPFPRRRIGDINHRHFIARINPSKLTQRRCTMCSGRVRRSWVTGILHARCRSCRYLVMMYGPNIEVRLMEE